MAASDKEPTKTENKDEVVTTTTTDSKTNSPRFSGATIGIAVAAGALLLLGGTAAGFVAGKVFDRDDRGTRVGFMQSGMRGDGEGITVGERFGGMHRHMMGGTIGKVTSVSDSSITLTDDRSGGSVTFKIDGNTDVNDKNGDNAKVSDIKVGDNVSVRGTSAINDTAADTIVINPNR